MTDNQDLNQLDDVTDDERDQAQRFADSLDALQRGRRGLDDLPNLGDDDPLTELLQTSLLLSARAPRAELETEREDAIWRSLEDAIPPPVRATTRRRRRWPFLIAGFAGALAAAFIAVLAVQTWRADDALLPRGDYEPVALLELESNPAPYVTQARSRATATPLGDTRTRDFRRARFQAYRSDLLRAQRAEPGDTTP